MIVVVNKKNKNKKCVGIFQGVFFNVFIVVVLLNQGMLLKRSLPEKVCIFISVCGEQNNLVYRKIIQIRLCSHQFLSCFTLFLRILVCRLLAPHYFICCTLEQKPFEIQTSLWYYLSFQHPLRRKTPHYIPPAVCCSHNLWLMTLSSHPCVKFVQSACHVDGTLTVCVIMWTVQAGLVLLACPTLKCFKSHAEVTPTTAGVSVQVFLLFHYRSCPTLMKITFPRPVLLILRLQAQNIINHKPLFLQARTFPAIFSSFYSNQSLPKWLLCVFLSRLSILCFRIV